MDYKEIAEIVMSKLLSSGSFMETCFANGDIDIYNDPFILPSSVAYKSTYRFISYLIAPTMGVRDKFLDGKLLGLDEVKQIMSAAHPYLKGLLESSDGLRCIETNYSFMVECWE